MWLLILNYWQAIIKDLFFNMNVKSVVSNSNSFRWWEFIGHHYTASATLVVFSFFVRIVVCHTKQRSLSISNKRSFFRLHKARCLPLLMGRETFIIHGERSVGLLFSLSSRAKVSFVQHGSVSRLQRSLSVWVIGHRQVHRNWKVPCKCFLPSLQSVGKISPYVWW